jgi:hypothetical protein
MVWHSYHCARIKEKQSHKKAFKFKIKLLIFMKIFTEQLILVAKGTLKLNNSQRKALGEWIITYIRVGVRDISRRLIHETKAGEAI